MEENKSKFRTKLEEFNREYETERTGFNIFRALHKEHNEKYLHSRFISNLLSSTSKHGKGNEFLKLFIERLSKTYPDLKKFNIDNCVVSPDEENKTEHQYIDIYIHNEMQAIIIENKIYAGDSNDHSKTEPEERIQLLKYYKTVKSDKKINEIFVLYLTPDRHDPEEIKLIEEYFHVLNIDYRTEILEWIESCINIIEDNYLKETLKQYRTVIISLTNDVKRAQKLKTLISEHIKNNFEETWKEKDFIDKMCDFKHVQWHTIDEFWRELADSIENSLNVKVKDRITFEEISGIVHKNKKKSYGISFILENGDEWYIVNDAINGLTYGKILEDMNIKRKEGEDWIKLSENIKFTDFSNEETFMLINSDVRRERIDEIINTLKANPLLAGFKRI